MAGSDPAQFTRLCFFAAGMTNVDGQLGLSATNGLTLQGYTGATYDMIALAPGGSNAIWRVPTGTQNVQIPNGTLTVDTGATSGAMPSTGRFTVKAIHSMTGTTDAYAGFFGLISPTSGSSPVAGGAYTYLSHTSSTTTLAVGWSVVAESGNAGTTTTMRAHDSDVLISGSGGGTDAVNYNAKFTGRTGGGLGTYTNGYGLKVGTKGSGITTGYSVYSEDGSVILFHAGPIYLAAAKKLQLDGATGSAYIYNRTGTVVTAVSGTQSLELDGTGLAMPAANPTTASAANCVIANSDYLRISTSSLRYKHDVQDVDVAAAIAAVKAFRPITYRGKTDTDQRRFVGLLAEDVQAVAPLLCTYDEGGESGTPNYVTYDRVSAYLICTIHDLYRRVEALEAR